MKNLPKMNIQLKNPLKNMSKKKKILLTAGAIVIIGGIAVLVSFNSSKNQMKENMEAAFTVETAQIERQTLANSISATGTVASAETKTVNTSLKDLEVVAVYVKEGDYVEEGTIICEFDASDYKEALAEAQHNAAINAQIDALEGDYTDDYNEALDNAFDPLKTAAEVKDDAEADYEDAEDDLDDAEDDLAAAKTNYNKAKAAYETIADELTVYSTDKSPLKEAESKYNDAVKDLAEKEAALAEKEAKGEDTTDASSTRDNSKGEVEKAKKEYDYAATRYNELLAIKSAYESAQTKYNSAKSAVDSAEKALEQAETALEQAEEKLDSAWETYDDSVEKADKQYAKAALEDQLISETQEEKTINQYTELIEDCVVKATMSGVITSLNVTEGNVFEGGDVYTIQDNEHFIVTSSVDEYDIASIEKGMPAYIKTDATGDVEMTGEVTYVAIAPTGSGAMGAISNSASYTIKVTIDEADENLRAGMTAKLSISLEESADTLTVPYDAVTTTPDGTSTITVDADGEKKTITVETGLETDYYTEIISDEIYEGMTVYLTTPMVTSTPSGSDDEDRNALGGLLNGGGMPSGNMPDRGGNRGGNGSGMPDRGSMPSGGGPGGF